MHKYGVLSHFREVSILNMINITQFLHFSDKHEHKHLNTQFGAQDHRKY